MPTKCRLVQARVQGALLHSRPCSCAMRQARLPRTTHPAHPAPTAQHPPCTHHTCSLTCAILMTTEHAPAHSHLQPQVRSMHDSSWHTQHPSCVQLCAADISPGAQPRSHGANKAWLTGTPYSRSSRAREHARMVHSGTCAQLRTVQLTAQLCDTGSVRTMMHEACKHSRCTGYTHGCVHVLAEHTPLHTHSARAACCNQHKPYTTMVWSGSVLQGTQCVAGWSVLQSVACARVLCCTAHPLQLHIHCSYTPPLHCSVLPHLACGVFQWERGRG